MGQTSGKAPFYRGEKHRMEARGFRQCYTMGIYSTL